MDCCKLQSITSRMTRSIHGARAALSVVSEGAESLSQRSVIILPLDRAQDDLLRVDKAAQK